MADRQQELTEVKQGNTFRLSLVFRDPTTKEPRPMVGKTVTVTLKTKAGITLTGAQINTIHAENGAFEAYAPPTATRAWPEGTVDVTIDVAEGSDLTSSRTFQILIGRR